MFKIKTVDSVMSTFTKTINSLQDIRDSKERESVLIEEQVTNLQIKADAAKKEAARANKFARKLSDLLEV